MMVDEETLKNEDEDNIHHKDYIMNASQSSFNESFFFGSRHDDMPLCYRHIRCGERQIKPEYYLLIHVLKSKYCMLENVVQGAIIEAANYLFGH